MATAKSDDEGDAAPHPLAENRPGVYVQVVAPRRRKKGKRGDSASSSHPPASGEGRASTRGKARLAAREETDARVSAREGSDPRAESDDSEQNTTSEIADGAPAAADQREATASALAGSAAEALVAGSGVSGTPALSASTDASEIDDEDDGRQSGERPVDLDSRFDARGEVRASTRAGEIESENTNDRSDLLAVTIPPPPRLPSFSSSTKLQREIATDPPAHGASLLDAPHSLRPIAESTPAAQPSSTLLAFVGACAAIIVMAGLVALRDVTKSEPAASATPHKSNSAPVGEASHRARSAHPTVEAPGPSAPIPRPAPMTDPSPEGSFARPALPLPAAAAASALPGNAVAKATARTPAVRQTAKPAAAKALVANANAALSNLKSTGARATPGTESEEPPAAEDEEVMPEADEPLELPVNPYR